MAEILNTDTKEFAKAERFGTIKRFYGWINVILLFAIYTLVMGMVFYGFSVIFPAMIKDLGWNRGTASIAHTVNVLFLGLFAPLAAFFINKIGTKKTILMGICLSMVGLLLMGTVMTRMWQWIIIWGLIMSLGFALCGFLPVVTVVVNWFNIKRATATGIVITGAAVGGFFAQPFFTWFMQLVDSWRVGWLSGVLFTMIALICSFFLINKPEDINQIPDGLSSDELAEAKTHTEGVAKTYRTAEGWELKEVFGNRIIYFWIIEVVCHLMPLFLITSHGILYFTDKGFSQMQAASILSFTILGSGAARFPSGWLGDRIEPRWILTATFVVQLFAFFLIWKSSLLQVLIGAGVIFGFCYGCQLTMNPTVIGNYYGREAFPIVSGVTTPLVVPFGAIVPVGAGYIFETYGSYDGAFLVMMVSLVIALIASSLLSPPETKG